MSSLKKGFFSFGSILILTSESMFSANQPGDSGVGASVGSCANVSSSTAGATVKVSALVNTWWARINLPQKSANQPDLALKGISLFPLRYVSCSGKPGSILVKSPC